MKREEGGLFEVQKECPHCGELVQKGAYARPHEQEHPVPGGPCGACGEEIETEWISMGELLRCLESGEPAATVRYIPEEPDDG